MYDPMVAKLIVWDVDREQATARMLRALDEYEVGGLTTLIPFHKALLATKQWANGETCRDLTEDKKLAEVGHINRRLLGCASGPSATGSRRGGPDRTANTRSRSAGSSSTSR